MGISTINVPRETVALNTVQFSPSSGTSDVTNKTSLVSTNEKPDQKSVDPKKVKQMTEAMNQLAEAMDVNIHFKVHEKTNELMVQVVEQTTNKVIKEFPPHEFLDTVAAIRSYVGILLDKKI